MSKSIKSNGCVYNTQGQYNCKKVIENMTTCGCPDGCKCVGDQCQKHNGAFLVGCGKDCVEGCSDDTNTHLDSEDIMDDYSDMIHNRKEHDNEFEDDNEYDNEFEDDYEYDYEYEDED
jgi:hypothetical protein